MASGKTTEHGAAPHPRATPFPQVQSGSLAGSDGVTPLRP